MESHQSSQSAFSSLWSINSAIGQMMGHTGTIPIFSFLFATTVCVAQTENPFQWFARIDTNKDGKLSYKEVPSPIFAQIDLDGDGYVTLDEFKSYLLGEALKDLDTDGDGKISQAEFLQLELWEQHRMIPDRQWGTERM